MIKLTSIFLFFSFASFAQTGADIDIEPTVEYYQKVMRMNNPSIEQFDTIWQVIAEYSRTSRDTFQILSKHAAEITENSSLPLLYGKALYLQGFSLGFDSIGYQLIMKAKTILEAEKDTTTLTNAQMYLGIFHQNHNEWGKSIAYQLEALELLEVQKDSVGLVNALTGIGGTYYQWGYLEKAINYLDKSISILKAIGQNQRLSATLSNKSKALARLGEKYIEMSDTAVINAQIYRDSADFFYARGLEDAEQSFEYAKNFGNELSEIAAMSSIAGIKNKLNQHQEAIDIALKALPRAENLGRPDFIANVQSVLAIAYHDLGQDQKALPYALASLELNPTENKEIILYEIYKSLGQTSKALNILESIRKKEQEESKNSSRKVFIEAETKYQTVEKEKEILQQKNDILELEATNFKVEKQRNYILGGGFLLALLGFFGYRINKIRTDRNDKKAFAEALIFAQEEERKRIARDLHDSVGQSLLLIIKKMDNNTEIVSENQQMISKTLEEVRAISGDLHPFKLDKFGLTATVTDMIEKIKASTNIFITKELDNIDKVLPAKSEIHLFRTIQEAWNNIVKHSEATAAKISSVNTADNLTIVIQDNGKGFDLELAIVKSKSLGIRTMHERILAIGGKLKIEEGQNGGTQLTITIPKK